MLRTLIFAVFAVAAMAFPVHLKMVHSDAKEIIPGEFIAVMNAAELSEQEHQKVAAAVNGTVLTVHTTFKAIAFKTNDDTVVLKMLNHPNTLSVEPNQAMHASQACSAQNPPLSWGQDRVTAQSADEMNDQLYYKTNDGTGVDAYIIDTGIYLTHTEFGGRAIFGVNTATGGNSDLNGHGTHVASTVAGATYGFAKKATLIAVKVLGDNGSGTTTGVIEGVSWASKRQGTSGKPSVGNMSLGGGASAALDAAVNSAVDGGLVMAVAAGNDNSNACNYSPARATKAITVGATELTNIDFDTQADRRSVFSNYGSCVDVLAPGTGITGAWCTSNTALKTISGTSMAAPHVAGIAAVFLGNNPSATPADVDAAMEDSGLKNQIDLACLVAACNLTPNLMLHRDC